MNLKISAIMGICILTQTLNAGAAELRPAEIFCDQMVLQRDVAVPVWGWAEPGAKITVKFAGQEKNAVAGPDGKWKLKLDPMPACAEPRSMTISDGRQAKTINGALVGDIWLCSGQSNMVYPFGGAPTGFDTQYPLIRQFTVPRSIALERQATFNPPRVMAGHSFKKATSWLPCTPATAGRFSGVGLFAAIEMFKELKVPIGIINCSFNGSTAVLWIPAEVLRKDRRYDWIFKGAEKKLAQYRKNIDQYEQDQALFMRMKGEMEQAGKAGSEFQDTQGQGFREGWMNPDCITTNWPKITWGWGYATPVYIWDGDSIVWFRILCVQIKPDGDVKLLGGEFRNCQARYFFNGIELKPSGKTKEGQDEFIIRRPEIKKGWLVVRAFSNNKMACIWRLPSSPDMRILPTPYGVYRVAESKASADKFRLAGHKYPPGGLGGYPGSRFNAMLNPLIPYALKGFIWYQGESECMQGIRHTKLYAHTLPLLVQTWRAAWGGKDKPFVAVQLAGHGYDPKKSFLMEMRESQKAVLALTNTALSPAMDIREPGNVHPRNKYDIGTRAGRSALVIGYKKNIPFSGPIFRAMKVEGSRIRMFFNHVGGGLTLGEKNGLEPVKFLLETNVPHFLIAGKDMKFVPANAKIDADTVLAWSEAIKEPAAVRYAWTNMPGNPLLYNREGLPACSFRSDEGDFKEKE